MRNSRSGLSVVDLVTVISFASLLLAVALPAIQHNREAVRNEACKNNLVTIGVAALEYEDVNGQFPPYMGLPFNPRDAVDFYDHSRDYQLTYSIVQLLEFIGQQELVDSIDPFAFDSSDMDLSYAGYADFFPYWLFGIDKSRPGIEQIFFDNQVQVYRCPADQVLPATERFLAGHPTNDGSLGFHYLQEQYEPTLDPDFRTITNYVTNAGAVGVTDTPSNPDWIGHWGPIRSRQSDSASSIADGASNVVLFGENVGDKLFVDDGRVGGSGSVAVGRPDLYGIATLFGTVEMSVWLQFGSPHPDTVNILRADGSVQAFNRNIQPKTFGQMCAVADGQPMFNKK